MVAKQDFDRQNFQVVGVRFVPIIIIISLLRLKNYEGLIINSVNVWKSLDECKIN